LNAKNKFRENEMKQQKKKLVVLVVEQVIVYKNVSLFACQNGNLKKQKEKNKNA